MQPWNNAATGFEAFAKCTAQQSRFCIFSIPVAFRNPAEMKPTRCTCGIRPTADQASYVGARRTAEGTDMKCRQTVSKQGREIVNIGWCTMWGGIRPSLTEKDGWLAGRHASSAADVNKRRPLRGLSVPRHLTCRGDDSAAGWMYLGAGQFPYRSNRAGGQVPYR